MKKKTQEDYHNLAHERGFKWLGEEVINTATPTLWECAQGHEWITSYKAIKRGSNCYKCSYEQRGRQRSYTAENYHELAKSRDIEWLGPNLVFTRELTKWRCKNGHEFRMRYNDIHNGRGCPHCSGRAYKTPEDYSNLAIREGIEWIGPFPKNTKIKTKWRCSEGHVWDAVYSNIRNNSTGCPYCSNHAPITPEQYYEAAIENQLEWLGPAVSTTGTKTNWQCQNGHVWEATYRDIKHNRNGCPFCYGNFKKDATYYYQLAKEKGFEWLGDVPPGTNEQTEWRCDQGHEFKGRYNDLLRHNGCPECRYKLASEKRRFKPQDYHVLANDCGVKWLGPTVSNVMEKTQWQCESGHIWETTYTGLRLGKGCRFCNNRSRGENKVAQILDSWGIKYEVEKRFDECRDSLPLPFDFYFKLNSIDYLIEYDGEFHFFPINGLGGEEAFAVTQKHDAIKNQFARSNGFTLIRVSYTDFDNIEQILEENVMVIEH